MTGVHGRRRLAASFTGLASAGFVVALALSTSAVTALASTAPGLGTAAGFAILAGTPAITNTGPSGISGSVGISPAASVTGFGGTGNATVSNGTIQAGTSAATTAQSDLTAAYGVAASSPCNVNETGQNLGGKVLTPGTYCQTTAPTLTGVLVLSGNGVFIFQAGSTLVTAPGAVVSLINGAQACNVFWQVSSSATLDTTTQFVGTILALTDIHINNGVTLTGRALARNGAVTLINDQITAPTTCNATTVAGPTPTPTPTPTSTSRITVPGTGAGSEPWTAAAVLAATGAATMLTAAAIGVRRRGHRVHRRWTQGS